MKKILVAVILVMGVLTVTNAFAVTLGSVFQWTSGTGHNDHYYRAATFGTGDTRTWTNADTLAESYTYASLNGYLATITSQAESDFIWTSLLGTARPTGYILGGYQDTSAPGYSEPGGGWKWVTGETWSSSFGGVNQWYTGEPNNYQGNPENYLEFEPNFTGTAYEKWNDMPNDAATRYNDTRHNRGFIVEYAPGAAVPEPASMSLLGLGLLGAVAGLRRRK